jgi:D-alanyl-lipoteichoic acid acyltransferase DltB (MBOAT superfamily)
VPCWRPWPLPVRIHRSAGDASRRKLLLWLAVAGNLGVLGYFKYYDFFLSSTQNLATLVGLDLPLELRTVILPIGISFYTFMALSYIVDVYRGDTEPTTLEKFAVYLSFFPHLVAGPIVRPNELIPQLDTPRSPRRVDTSRAFYLIAAGLFKKVVISSYLASNIVDEVFADPTQHSSLEILIAV